MSWLKAIFSGSGVIKSVENIATEWIETDLEKAEAKTLMLKTLDPNGAMRRQLSRDVSNMYKVYLFSMVSLLIIEFGCAFFNIDVNTDALATASSKVVELFLPITSLFGVIVTASFGVNYANVKKGESN